MKAKKLLFFFVLLMGFIPLGCNSDDAYSGSDSNAASLVPNPPIGEKLQFLPLGSTIGDIRVSGTNIRWYKLPSTLDSSTGNENQEPSSISNRTLLSVETSLQNKNTYYATQTINNVESKSYLKVSVKLW